MSDDGYVCNAIVDGKLAFTQNFKYNGIAENSNGDMKYTVETSLAEVKYFNISQAPEYSMYLKSHGLQTPVSKGTCGFENGRSLIVE